MYVRKTFRFGATSDGCLIYLRKTYIIDKRPVFGEGHRIVGNVPDGGGSSEGSSDNQSGKNSTDYEIPVDSNGVPYKRPQFWLPKDEYAHVMGTISTHYDSKFKGKSIGMIELEFNDQWAWYRFEIHGFNEYNIFDKEE